MAGDVIRKRWRYDERHPVQFWFSESNRGYRSPEVEGVLGVPRANGSVGHRDVQERKQPSVFLERVALRVGNNLRNAVPVAGRRFGAGAVGPEQGDLGLLFCARRANSRAELLDLIVVRCVSLAIESRRARRTELRAAAHCKRHNESPLRQQIRKERRRGRHPHAGTAAARWRDDSIGTIIRARGEYLVRDEFTPYDAGVFRGPSGIVARIAA